MALARERTQKTKGRCQSQTIRFCRGDKTAKLEGMLKIMRSFQNFSNQQVIRFVRSHLPIQTDFSKTLNYGVGELIGMSARKLLGVKNPLVLMRFNEFIPYSLCEGSFKRHR